MYYMIQNALYAILDLREPLKECNCAIDLQTWLQRGVMGPIDDLRVRLEAFLMINRRLIHRERDNI